MEGTATAAEPPEPPEERQKVLVGYGPRAASVKRRARKGAVASVDSEKVPQHKPLRALAKPPVRKLAKDLGVDLGAVPSTGEIITRADVEAFAGRPGALRRGPPVSFERRTFPIKGVRKMTAEAMVSSAFTAPHVTEWVTVDVTRTVELVSSSRRTRCSPTYASRRC